MLSHKKKFIFIHVYKVAGSSIRKVLHQDSAISFRQSSLKDKWISLSKGVKYSSDFDGHITALQLKNSLPADIFNTYYKFAFVRNPWDWQVSLYLFGLKDKNHFQHELFKSFANFEAYLDWRIREDLHLQKDFLVDDSGNLLVDFVGKLENLKEDFEYVCNKIQIQSIDLPHLNKSNSEKYQRFYNERTKQLLADAFKEDIEFFNYSYDNDRKN
jgi:hypothetical protein